MEASQTSLQVEVQTTLAESNDGEKTKIKEFGGHQMGFKKETLFHFAPPARVYGAASPGSKKCMVYFKTLDWNPEEHQPTTGQNVLNIITQILKAGITLLPGGEYAGALFSFIDGIQSDREELLNLLNKKFSTFSHSLFRAQIAAIKSGLKDYITSDKTSLQSAKETCVQVLTLFQDKNYPLRQNALESLPLLLEFSLLAALVFYHRKKQDSSLIPDLDSKLNELHDIMETYVSLALVTRVNYVKEHSEQKGDRVIVSYRWIEDEYTGEIVSSAKDTKTELRKIYSEHCQKYLNAVQPGRRNANIGEYFSTEAELMILTMESANIGDLQQQSDYIWKGLKHFGCPTFVLTYGSLNGWDHWAYNSYAFWIKDFGRQQFNDKRYVIARVAYNSRTLTDSDKSALNTDIYRAAEKTQKDAGKKDCQFRYNSFAPQVVSLLTSKGVREHAIVIKKKPQGDYYWGYTADTQFIFHQWFGDYCYSVLVFPTAP